MEGKKEKVMYVVGCEGSGLNQDIGSLYYDIKEAQSDALSFAEEDQENQVIYRLVPVKRVIHNAPLVVDLD